MQSLIPEDIKIDFAFDQSVYVTHALRGLLVEGALGALLTGLVVWLFLRDLRSAAIVVVTIPFALLGALVGLWLTGQTVNIMTLGGLALAIGILVDEATVAIENIHTHLAAGESKAAAVLRAGRETIGPRLLAMLSILAVFVPSFFMIGVARSLFVPLSLAVGFAMLASYVLSNTLVPVLAAGLLRDHPPQASHTVIDRVHATHERVLTRAFPLRWLVLAVYLVVTLGGAVVMVRYLGTELFPAVDTGQFQLRLRAPTGTRVERTEEIALKALKVIDGEAGQGNVATSLAFVGTVPSTYPINSIYLWSSGSHEALLTVALKSGTPLRVADLQERLRQRMSEELPGTTVSFEAADVVSQVMNFGAPTPIEVTVTGANLAADRAFAGGVMAEMRKIGVLRDLQFAQSFDYPTVDIQIDRERAGQLGVTIDQIGRSLAIGTSSSRYITPNYWRDPANGIAYQLQVEIPQARIASLQDVANVPAMPSGAARPLLGDVAQVGFGTTVGEYDRYNQQRMVTITANTSGRDLGGAARQVRDAVTRAGDPPRGVTVTVRGQVAPMDNTLAGLRTGVGVAIVVIFLLMAANFQSLRLAVVVLSTVPAVLLGVAAALLVTGTTLNVQSFMGAIMAIGVSVANAILVVTFAERDRREGAQSDVAALRGVRSRMRPVLMTSLAMTAGMIPMAMALGQGGEQTAPLGRAVIGGLTTSTLAVLLVLPLTFSIAQRRVSRTSGSWHPDDAAPGN